MKTMGNGRKNTKKRSVYHGQLNCLMEFRRRYCYSAAPEYMCAYKCMCVCVSVIFRGFLMLSVSPFRQIGILAIPRICVVLHLFFNRIRWQIKIGYYRIKQPPIYFTLQKSNGVRKNNVPNAYYMYRHTRQVYPYIYI